MTTNAENKASTVNTVLLLAAAVIIFVWMQFGTRWLVGFENFWSVQTSQAKIQQGEKLLLLDVRTPEEFNAGHILNTVNMPMKVLNNTLQNDLEGFKQRYKDYTILSICRSDSRATTAARWLQAEGIEVKVLNGGMIAWSKAALPIEKMAK